MSNNTNNSNILSSFNHKELLRERVASSNLNITADRVINACTNEIDINKFDLWFEDNKDKIANANNRQRYFDKAFLDQYNKGTFKLKEIAVETSQLVDAMRGKGIKVTSNDTAYIFLMWQEIARQGMNEEEIIKLNHKIIDYMSKEQTFADYVSLVKRSNAIKAYDVDWEKIEKTYQEEIEWWDRALNELSLEALPNE